MTHPQKYAGLRNNKNRLGKTKPEAEKKSSSITIPCTAEEKGILKAAAYPQKMAAVYLPPLLKKAKDLQKTKFI